MRVITSSLTFAACDINPGCPQQKRQKGFDHFASVGQRQNLDSLGVLVDVLRHPDSWLIVFCWYRCAVTVVGAAFARLPGNILLETNIDVHPKIKTFMTEYVCRLGHAVKQAQRWNFVV